MARGQIRAEYVKDDDYTAQQSPRSQDDSSQYDTRYGCGFDAPCRILAGVILGFGDLVSPSSRSRRGDNDQTRSDSGSRRDGELFGCLDYDFGFRASSSGGGTARGGAQRSQASFEVDSRSDRSDTGDTRSRQDISSDRGTE